jgi:hypothetical protein
MSKYCVKVELVLGWNFSGKSTFPKRETLEMLSIKENQILLFSFQNPHFLTKL